MSAGKGDRRRSGEDGKKFMDNYDAIFNKKKKADEKKPK